VWAAALADEPDPQPKAAPDANTPSPAAPDAPGAPDAPDAAPEAPAVPVQTVTVTEDSERVASDPAAFATVLRAADWADRITNLADLLRDVVGVQVKSLGGEYATVSIRGSSAEQVMVYLDGVPLNRALGGGVNLGDLPLAQLDRIEVYRGMTPASLPEASIGGAILLHSRAAAGGGPQGDAAASVGTLGSGEVRASYGGSGDRGSWLAAMDGATTDGDFLYWNNNGTPDEPGDDFERRRVNNDFTRAHAMGNGRVRAGDTTLTFSADLFRRDQGVPGLDALQSETARLTTSRMVLSARAERPGLASGRLRLEGGLGRTEERDVYDGSDENLAIYARSSDNRIVSNGLDGGGTYVLGAHQAISFLAAARRETADLADPDHHPSDKGTATRSSLTATLEDQISLAGGRILLSPALRSEHARNDFAVGPAAGLVPLSGEPNAGATTGKIGLRADLGSGWLLRANGGTFLRLPDFIELYGDRGSIVGNAGLAPEHGRNLDAGIGWTAARQGETIGDLFVEAVLFETRAEDLIIFFPTPQSLVRPENVGAARIRGAELTFAARFGARLHGSLNAVRQNAVDTSDTIFNGKLLPGRARDEASAAATLDAGRTRLSWDFTYIGPNYMDGLNTEVNRLPSRYLHDVSCRVALPHRLEATATIHNVFDDRTVDVARFPLPGRRFEARLQWTF
jgi:iron complex outermembrane receptor protein